MNRHDRKAWKAARTLDDLGELVIRWMNGEIKETPSHMGGPCAETIPLIPELAVMNRGGFITTNSSRADIGTEDEQSAWVCGFAADATLPSLRDTAAGTPLELGACRRCWHECERSGLWWRCPWADELGFWSERCPALAATLECCWLVSVYDPEPGRNDLLWGTLTHALTRSAT